MKKVRKAVIPAAGLGTRFLPATKALAKEMLPIIDIPTIQYIVEEAVASGIEEILIITNKNKIELENYFGDSKELIEKLKKNHKEKEIEICKRISNMCKVSFAIQEEQKGLGHAILCAEDFVKDEPFAVLLGDDVMYNEQTPIIKQCINAFYKVNSCVVGCQRVSIENICKYGAVEYKDCETLKEERIYKCHNLVEKPKIEEAPSNLAVLGRYVLTPLIFKYLKTQKPGINNEIQLTDAIFRTNQESSVYAYEFIGKRYDVGDKFGYIQAQIDYALRREEFKEQTKQYILNLVKQWEK